MSATDDKKVALAIVMATAETIRELGSVHSGQLYAHLMTVPALSQLTTIDYLRLIGTLKAAGLVEERSHLLTWIGPKFGEESQRERSHICGWKGRSAAANCPNCGGELS